MLPKFVPNKVSVAPPLLAELNGVMAETTGELKENSDCMHPTSPPTVRNKLVEVLVAVPWHSTVEPLVHDVVEQSAPTCAAVAVADEDPKLRPEIVTDSPVENGVLYATT